MGLRKDISRAFEFPQDAGDYLGPYIFGGCVILGALCGVLAGFMEGGIGGAIAGFFLGALGGAVAGIVISVVFGIVFPLLMIALGIMVIVGPIYLLVHLLWGVGKP